MQLNLLLQESSRYLLWETPQQVPALLMLSLLPFQAHASEARAGTQEHQNSNATCFRAEQRQCYSASCGDLHTRGHPHAEQTVVNTCPPVGEKSSSSYSHGPGTHSKATLHWEQQ